MELAKFMQIVDSVGLDPDESDHSKTDEDVFQPLVKFLESDMTADERDRFFSCTLPYISQCALALKQHKSSMGLSFSLQQQVDNRKISHEFVSSLVAHSFFSSFPKRTSKTHPTLQDFNFSNFFLQLDQSFQQVKFRCLLHYFDCLSKFGHPQEPISISRQVMSGREWLTIEDWLECNLPLCPLSIKHDGRLERFDSSDSLLVCSSSSRLGGHVLNAGSSRECIQFCECPELIALLLFFEALEDNEVCIVENVLKVAKISDVRQKTNLELLEEPQPMYICLMDAENYTRLPLSQYEEDNVLRELNKALLGFRQKQQQTQQVLHNSRQHSVTIGATTKRLSPIGESFSSTPPPEPDLDLYSHSAKARRSFSKRGHSGSNGVKGGDWGGARLAPPSTGKWIMLGSSGECLPISRHQCMPIHSSANRNDSKDEDTFYSANSSFEQDDDDDKYDDVFLDDNEAVTSPFKYECELKTPERRHTFAERLKEALQREQSNGSFRLQLCGRNQCCGIQFNRKQYQNEAWWVEGIHARGQLRYRIFTKNREAQSAETSSFQQGQLFQIQFQHRIHVRIRRGVRAAEPMARRIGPLDGGPGGGFRVGNGERRDAAATAGQGRGPVRRVPPQADPQRVLRRGPAHRPQGRARGDRLPTGLPAQARLQDQARRQEPQPRAPETQA
ncbi:unnamed protein product [Bemisia tabaci]|uniref:poly(ADP-ribose) glycohydrolase n=1 Tax=Bemisia tabaci TaxID=7038 RepID=A0A9P0G1Y2_BEMTA|nr:unnamed protein product [Bemisia tabaci]